MEPKWKIDRVAEWKSDIFEQTDRIYLKKLTVEALQSCMETPSFKKRTECRSKELTLRL